MNMEMLFQYHPWAYRFHDATVTHDHHNHMKIYDHFEMILIMLMFTVLMIEFGSMPSMYAKCIAYPFLIVNTIILMLL